MKLIRTRLTYANVMSTIAVFLVLGGGAAFAASRLGKNSVGATQLKNNAVTGVKIKDGSVTSGKIAAGAVSAEKISASVVSGDKLAAGAVAADKIAPGAVTGDKLAPGAVTGEKINAATTPFSQVVQRIRGTQEVPVNGGDLYPLDNSAYVQPAGEDDQYVGAVDVTFPPNCASPRSAVVVLQADAADPTNPKPANEIGIVEVTDTGTTRVTHTGQFGAVAGSALTMAAPAIATPHTFSVRIKRANCSVPPTGAPALISGVRLDVIGTR